ncbi:MAG: DUF1186 domain-containing protein [Ktedonobacteraceae bacterium]
METTNYPAPVDTLLTFGTAKDETVADWSAHLASGIGPEHISDLIRMAKDESLRYKYFDEEAYPDFNEDEHPEYWAPIHALHTLAALHAASASEPLLPLFDEAVKNDDDWVAEDLPDVYGMFGPEAISPLASYIAEQNHDTYAKGYAIEALQSIAAKHPDPDTSEKVGAVLTKQLEHFEENSEEVNASLIVGLVKLQAVDAAPLIERAFAANKVDLLYMGDWDDVQVELGLQTTQQLDDKRRKEWEEEVAQREKEHPANVAVSHPYATLSHPHKQAAKKKAKAKMAKMARKRNKPKKK